MNVKVNTQQTELSNPLPDRVSSFPVSNESGPGVAGAGAAGILKHLQTIDRLSGQELTRMNNNGATALQKQAMALARADISSAIEDLMVVVDSTI